MPVWKIPIGWQSLPDYCRAHRIPYQRAYRYTVMERRVPYRRLGERGPVIIEINQPTAPFASVHDGRRKRRKKAPELPPVYVCGRPECIYRVCNHTKR